jgi:hypothetical protein
LKIAKVAHSFGYALILKKMDWATFCYSFHRLILSPCLLPNMPGGLLAPAVGGQAGPELSNIVGKTSFEQYGGL